MEKYRLVNKKKFVGFVLFVAVVTTMLCISVDFIRFPECYISTWRYQLQKVETLKVLINEENLALFVEEQKRVKELTEGAE